MVKEYRCKTCGKHFYFSGKVEKGLSMIIQAIIFLDENNFPTGNISYPWEIIQSNAKCCNDPDLVICGSVQND